MREKFRIRLYNHDHSLIRLEKKVKHYGSGAKLKARVTKEEVQRILSNNIAGSIIIGIILVVFVNKNVVETHYIVMINCTGESAEKTL